MTSAENLNIILNSIGETVIVYDAENKELLFENESVRKAPRVRRAMIKSVERSLERHEDVEMYYFDEYVNIEKCYTGEDVDIAKIIRVVRFYDTMSGLWYETKISNIPWTDGRMVNVCTAKDVTLKKKNQQKIEYQANNDYLTGLYNRMKCESDIKAQIKRCIKNGTKGALLFIDLDNFKHINDGLGHQYGDLLLQKVSAALQGLPGLKGHCYRMGGDEFVVIITPDVFDLWEKTARNIVTMFNNPWVLMETEYFCTMSMGVAFFPQDGRDFNEIIKMADMAMYEAKKAGKNRYNVYDSRLNDNTEHKLDIESGMRQAIASEIDEFVVYYQPVVSLRKGRCVSCEALVRWNSKLLGFMGPGEFVPLAEYLGLITNIGEHVLRQACIQCKEWNDRGYTDFHINVNLSVVQLLQKDIVKSIETVLKETGVNPANIVLEITESFAINDMDRVLNVIRGLKDLGPKIALDDFGTGYSSLNYIKQLPLDYIKVDKTFIDDILEDGYARAFVKLIVNLSETIDAKVIVEGVEHKEQRDILEGLGVDFIQGYLFGKPCPAEVFEKEQLGYLHEEGGNYEDFD